MKIVMLCDFYNEDLEYQENLLAKYYVKHGHEVIIITSTFESVFDYYSDKHDNSKPMRTYHHGGARIIKLPYRFNIANRLRAYTRIDPILEEFQPDLIYVHDIMLNLPECIDYKKRHKNCRMILDYHADYSNSGKNWLSLKVLHGIARKWYLDQARPHLSKIFPIVPASATFLNDIYDVPHAEMELLPLGADIDLINDIRAEGSRTSLRERYGIGADQAVIFTGGKLAPAKRTELLIDALGMLSTEVHLMVIGQASESDAAYEALIKAKGSKTPNVRFTGWLGKTDIYRHLLMSDLAVFPASQSILWQQAIACGLPLICGDSGHQSAAYLNTANNIIIIERDNITPGSLSKSIASVIDNPAKFAEMRRGANKVATEVLDWNILINKTLRFN